MAQEIDIQVNLSTVQIPSGTRLGVLLEFLWMAGGVVAELVAVDGVHVPSNDWESMILTPGAHVDTVSC
jgi:sulfur carrier protein ThiS